MKGDESSSPIKMVASIIIIIALVIVAIAIAAGGLDRLNELADAGKIADILKIFGIGGGTG
jgi:hypothetical protein